MSLVRVRKRKSEGMIVKEEEHFWFGELRQLGEYENIKVWNIGTFLFTDA